MKDPNFNLLEKVTKRIQLFEYSAVVEFLSRRYGKYGFIVLSMEEMEDFLEQTKDGVLDLDLKPRNESN